MARSDLLPLVPLLLCGSLLASSPAHADAGAGADAAAQDDGDGSRLALNQALRVLRARPDAAGRACLDAMAGVRQTEQQLKDEIRHAPHPASADSDPIPDPDLDVARDVLASDNEAAAHACGVDASRACASPRPPDLAGACAGLGAAGPP